MERLFQLIEKLVAKIRYVWIYFRTWNRWTYLRGPNVLFVPGLRLKARQHALTTVLRVRSGKGASSVIPLTKRILKRRPRTNSTQATGRWTLARLGADSLTPLDLIIDRFTDKRR